MPGLKEDRKYLFYRCGRCNGLIPYLKKKGKPEICPECGYGHGERDVRDVPPMVKLNLNNLNQEQSASRGKLEQTTITSR